METVPFVKRPWAVYMVVAVCGFACLAGAMFVGASYRWFSPDTGFTVGVIAAIAGLIVVLGLASAAASARLTERLMERGFQRTAPASKFWRSRMQVSEDAERVFRCHSGVRSSGYFAYAAFKADEAGETWVMRHVIPRGKYSEFRLAVLRTHERHWPTVMIRKRGIADTLKSLFKSKPVPIDDAFDKKVAVWSERPDFASLLLGPELQSVCLGLKSHEQLTVDHLGVSIVNKGLTLPSSGIRTLDTLESAVAALAPELDVWENGGI